MGIIKPGLNDVFFSYAHDDNDRHDNYVLQFFEHFKRKFVAEMGARNKDQENVAFFIDKNGMPSNGLPSNELMEQVKKSVFLFVFFK